MQEKLYYTTSASYITKSVLEKNINKILKSQIGRYSSIGYLAARTHVSVNSVDEVLGDYVIKYIRENEGISFIETRVDTGVNTDFLLGLINDGRVDAIVPPSEEEIAQLRKEDYLAEQQRNQLMNGLSNQIMSNSSQNDEPSGPIFHTHRRL